MILNNCKRWWERDLARIEEEARDFTRSHESFCGCAVCQALGLIRDALWQLSHNVRTADLMPADPR